MSNDRSNRTPIAASDTSFALGVTLLFILVCGFTISHHEMWRDEMQAWLMARDSTSLGELFQRIKYEGHPATWYLLLFALTRFTHRPEAMQCLHVAIAGAASYVFLRFAPFARWARAALCLGYFPLYEYGVVSRNYSLGLLCLFSAAALFAKRRERPWLLGLTLVAAAATSVHALLLAAAMAAAVALEPFISQGTREDYVAAAKTFGLTLFGSLATAITLRPPADSGFSEEWLTGWDPQRFQHVLGFFSRAVLPLPSGRAVWGDLWLDSVSYQVASLLSLVLAALVVIHLLRHRVALAMFVAGGLGLFSFYYVKYSGSIRHQGFFFLNLLLALWIAEVVAGERDRPTEGRWFWRAAAVVVVLHVAASAVAVKRDLSLVFSGGRATAALLVEHGLDALPIVGDPDYSLPPVLGYLDRGPVYYPRGRRYGSFIVLNTARRGVVTDDDVIGAARALASEHHSPVAIVLNRHASPTIAAAAEEIGCRDAVLTTRESYCVYRFPEK